MADDCNDCDGRGLTTKFAKPCWRSRDDAYWWRSKTVYGESPGCCSPEKAPAVLGPGPPAGASGYQVACVIQLSRLGVRRQRSARPGWSR
jgi:hypothetical protein